MNRLISKAALSRVPSTFCRLIAARYSSDASTKDRIESLVKDKNLVLFMKGTPDAPRCGFSNAVVQILKFHGVDNFESHNVLEDEDLRQGVKEYSNWPTIPQIFIKGEFIGGCDIIVDMHKNGELIEELQKIGIRSALLDDPNKKA